MDLTEIYQGLLAGPNDDDKSKALNMGMLTTGLGLLGRKNIGEAGILGLGQYQNQLKSLEEHRKSKLQQQMLLMQLKKQMDQQGTLKNIYGLNAPTEPVNSGAPLGIGGVSMPGGMQGNMLTGQVAQATQPAQKNGASLQDLQRLRAAGMDINPDVKLFELANPKTEVHGGIAFNPRMLSHGQRLPQQLITPQGQGVETIVGPDNRTTVSPMAESVPTFSAFERAKEEAKAGYTPFLGELDSSNRPIPQTVQQFVNKQRGAAGSMQSSPGQSGMGMTPGEKTLQEGRAKNTVEFETKLSEAAALSANLVSQLKDAERNLAKFEPGKLTPLSKFIGQWAISIKLMTPEEAEEKFGNISSMEALQGSINRLAALAVRQTDAQPAVRQIDMIMKSFPNLDHTPQGAMLLLDTLRKNSELQIEKANYWEKWKEAGKGDNASSFENWWNAQVQVPTFFNPNYNVERGMKPKMAPATNSPARVRKYNPATGKIE
jgi:hypothetical protein